MQTHTLIYAIRHGETAWNASGRIQGQTDIELNETGLWQAQRARDALAQERIHAVHASDLARAFETARAIAKPHRLTVTAHGGLRERGFGSFEGHSFAEIEASAPDDAKQWRKRVPDYAPPGGGESLLALRDRVKATVEAIAARHLNQAIVLVAHGGVLDVIYRAAAKLELQAPRTWSLDNCAINRLMWSPEHGLHIIGWNDVFHLDDASRDDALA
jgi:2,3-bisphosphoglycerate-dependent phosphoglycerate mutase